MRRRRRGGGRRCMAPGCGRFVQSGQATCADHRESAAGRDATVALRRMAAAVASGEADGRRDGETDGRVGGQVEREERRRVELAEGFRRRLERGDYRALLDERLREVMAQAAEQRGLAEEVGALRFAMARLLAAEEDPGALALGISRLAT
ncbi:MAG: hypothetical protein QOF73_4983, partial [Thermomicrobiales bacterium]|nr:hypothetical protein [Thermomicrobiales bacterium]